MQQRLDEYAAKPSENWRKKDAVIYLVTSSASRGQTQKHGVTQSNEFVPIPQFATQHIQPELAKSDGKYIKSIKKIFSSIFNNL